MIYILPTLLSPLEALVRFDIYRSHHNYIELAFFNYTYSLAKVYPGCGETFHEDYSFAFAVRVKVFCNLLSISDGLQL